MEGTAAKERQGESLMEKARKPQKVSDLLKPCPVCGVKPQLWEETYYGIPVPKFHAECPKCGRMTAEHTWPKWVIATWNSGHIKEKTNRDLDMDNDGLITLMGEVVAQAARDYQWYATRTRPTGLDKRYIKDIEEFILENPYALPYDNDFVLEKMRKEAAEKLAEKTRKKQVS